MINKPKRTTEDSGGSCSYYEVIVEYPIKEEKEPYLAECADIVDALELNQQEANMFKEIWRTAAARQGRKKRGNNTLRAAEKILFFAQINLSKVKRKLAK